MRILHQRRSSDGIAGPTGIGNTPNCLLVGIFDLAGEFKGKRWDWRVVTDYRFSDEFLAYASVATGYKGGGVNPRPFFGPATGECGPFQFNPDGTVIPARRATRSSRSIRRR